MKKLYLKSWEFNSYRIINQLAKIVEKNGGKIVTQDFYKSLYFDKYGNKNKIKIKNRGIMERITELKNEVEKLTRLSNEGYNVNKNYLREVKKELAQIRKIKNTFIELDFENYLTFYIDGFIYYVELPENPFFDFHFQKKMAKAENGKYIVEFNYYLGKLSKDFAENYTSYYSDNLSDTEVEKIAQRLFDSLENYCESSKVWTTKAEYCHCCNRLKYRREVEHKKAEYIAI